MQLNSSRYKHISVPNKIVPHSTLQYSNPMIVSPPIPTKALHWLRRASLGTPRGPHCRDNYRESPRGWARKQREKENGTQRSAQSRKHETARKKMRLSICQRVIRGDAFRPWRRLEGKEAARSPACGTVNIDHRDTGPIESTILSGVRSVIVPTCVMRFSFRHSDARARVLSLCLCSACLAVSFGGLPRLYSESRAAIIFNYEREEERTKGGRKIFHLVGGRWNVPACAGKVEWIN